jgi:hypothetical protein
LSHVTDFLEGEGPLFTSAGERTTRRFPRCCRQFRIGDPNLGDGFTLRLNTPIACLSRVRSHLDLFAVGKDTAVYTTYYDDNGGGHGHWFRIGDPNFGDGFTLPLNTPIACLSRVPSLATWICSRTMGGGC